jgi:hypothetical protein
MRRTAPSAALIVAALIIVTLAIGCRPAAMPAKALPPPTPETLEVSMQTRPKAPDFPATLEWLNTDKPVSLRDLKGKVVLLDFWTFG